MSKWKKITRAETHHICVNFFFDGLLHVSCLGWEVNAHVSSQSNDCLRVCNVKMKKNSTRAGTEHISMHIWVTGP